MDLFLLPQSECGLQLYHMDEKACTEIVGTCSFNWKNVWQTYTFGRRNDENILLKHERQYTQNLPKIFLKSHPANVRRPMVVRVVLPMLRGWRRVELWWTAVMTRRWEVYVIPMKWWRCWHRLAFLWSSESENIDGSILRHAAVGARKLYFLWGPV